MSANPLSPSLADTLTVMLSAVTSSTTNSTVGAFLSSIVMLALFPTFVPSVNLAYTVSP